MRIQILRTFSVLALAGAAAACGDAAPTAPGQASPVVSRAGTQSTALAATVNCTYYGSYPYPYTYDCTAQASGGSGTGYSFSWHGTATEYYDQGGVSKAYVPCNKNYTSGYPSSGSLTAYGTVTDSNGSSAYFSLSRSC